MSSSEVLMWVASELAKGRRVALITIIDKQGSGPRDVGAVMAISSSGERRGTIGGGDVERILVEEASKALQEGKPRRVKVSLGAERAPSDAIPARALCGGVIEAFINVFNPRPRLILVGAGNVGKPIADIANIMGYRVVVIDSKPELASPERYPYAERVVAGSVVEEVEKLELEEGDVAVIAYGEPEVDYQVLKRLILKGFKGHIWALCSRRRASWMLERLQREGVNIEPFKGRIHAPAGLDIGSDTPEEIAISIWAEIICEQRSCVKPVGSLSIFK
jgi:xanthine dehydrogenase accessory factor